MYESIAFNMLLGAVLVAISSIVYALRAMQKDLKIERLRRKALKPNH